MKNIFILFSVFLLESMTHLSYAQTEQDSTKNDIEYIEISVQPEFPGGIEAMNKFISTHLKYPYEAVDNAIEGFAAIQFIVEKDGLISNIKVVKNPGGGLGEEGKRVVELMPKWKPGLDANGLPTRVQMVIPIRFSLSSKSKKSK